VAQITCGFWKIQVFLKKFNPHEYKTNRTEERQNLYPLVCRRPAEILSHSGEFSTKIYDKRDDFNFKIINFSNMCSNIPASPAYGVYISPLISSALYIFTMWKSIVYYCLCRDGIYFDKILVSESLTEFGTALTTILPMLYMYCYKYCNSDSRNLWAVMKAGGLALKGGWNVKSYWKYGRKVSRIVIRYGQYRRKVSQIAKREWKYGRKASRIVKTHEK
jgi:hypothetical protein